MSSRFKKVSVSKSTSLAIFALIAILIFCFVPISFGTSNGVIFTYNTLPFISNGSIIKSYVLPALVGLQNAIPEIPSEVFNIVYQIFTYGIPAILIIFAINFVSGIILAISRANALRVIFKILGIFMGIIMIVSFLMFLIYVVGCVCLVIAGAEILLTIQTSGFVLALVMMIISIISARKNFSAYNLA